MDEIVITYEQDNMIVTHPTGVVCRYTFDDMNALRSIVVAERDEINELIECIDDYLLNIQESTVVRP